MATQAQIDANRINAQKSTGPASIAGKARSSQNRLSHGFTSAMFFIPLEEREEFNLLLADLQDEFQPATASEQILLEKIAQNQWLSLRACRLQSIVLNSSVNLGYIHKDLGVLIRYQQSSDRSFFRAKTEFLKAQKERKKSEIGFVSQNAAEPAETPAPAPNAPEPPQETPAVPDMKVPERPEMPAFVKVEDQFEAVMNEPYEEIAKTRIAELRGRCQAA